MKSPNTTNGGASNFSFKSYNEDTKMFSFLKAAPHLKFSSTEIINNIANRLCVVPAHLIILIGFVCNEENANEN